MSPGPRPWYGLVADSLWPGRDVDSDGDSDFPASTSWTELTLILRSDLSQRIDVDPVSLSSMVLRISATTSELASRVATILQQHCGGRLVAAWT